MIDQLPWLGVDFLKKIAVEEADDPMGVAPSLHRFQQDLIGGQIGLAFKQLGNRFPGNVIINSPFFNENFHNGCPVRIGVLV